MPVREGRSLSSNCGTVPKPHLVGAAAVPAEAVCWRLAGYRPRLTQPRRPPEWVEPATTPNLLKDAKELHFLTFFPRLPEILTPINRGGFCGVTPCRQVKSETRISKFEPMLKSE